MLLIQYVLCGSSSLSVLCVRSETLWCSYVVLALSMGIKQLPVNQHVASGAQKGGVSFNELLSPKYQQPFARITDNSALPLHFICQNYRQLCTTTSFDLSVSLVHCTQMYCAFVLNHCSFMAALRESSPPTTPGSCCLKPRDRTLMKVRGP